MGKLRYLFSRVKFLIKKTLQKQDYIFNADVQDLVCTISENGFAVIPNFYSQSECKFLKDEIDLSLEM